MTQSRRRGRGAVSNATGRFEPERRERFDDGWESLEDLEPFKTEVREEAVKTIIATNCSPDLGFDRSINPYRGCEHGCIYCYARPSHAYWGYSAGLDFETKLTAKVNAAEALEKELSKPGYSPATIVLGANTDAYQPIERERKITRGMLEVLDRFRPPCGDRDEIGAGCARPRHPLAACEPGPGQSYGVRDDARPHACAENGAARIYARQADRGHPPAFGGRCARSGAGCAVDPGAQRSRVRTHPGGCAAAGASEAGYVLLRLPLEICPLFQEWLEAEFPGARRPGHVARALHAGRQGLCFAFWRAADAAPGPMRRKSRRASSSR